MLSSSAGFLAADIGAGAAAHVHARTARRQLCDLALEHFERGRIFVAQIDVDVGRVDDMRADQHAFEEAMRIGIEIEAILERAGLALVAIDAISRGPGSPSTARHLRPVGKARAAEPAQGGVVERPSAGLPC